MGKKSRRSQRGDDRDAGAVLRDGGSAGKASGGSGVGSVAASVAIGCAIGALAMYAATQTGLPLALLPAGGHGHGDAGASRRSAAAGGNGVGGGVTTEVLDNTTDIMIDCSGVRFHADWVRELIGDGECDNGWTSVNLSCAEYDMDGDDCEEGDENVFIKTKQNGFVDEDGDGAKARDPAEVYILNTDTDAWLRAYGGPDAPTDDTVPLPARRGPKYGVTDAMVRRYNEDGHVFVPGLLDASEIEPFREPIKRAINAQAEQPVGGKSKWMAFRRTMDSFRRVPGSAHWNFTVSPRLGAAAARLMGTKGALLYMDQLFFKYSGDHETAWHADMPMFPTLPSAPCISAWVPLVPVGPEHGPLEYLTGSHRNDKGVIQYVPWNHPQLVKDGDAARQALLANEYDDPVNDQMFLIVEKDDSAKDLRTKQDDIIMRNYGDDHVVDYGRRKAGDISFHSCKTLHATRPNSATDNRTREAVAIVFIGTEISKFSNKNDPNNAPALMPKDELRRIGNDNAGFFKLPVNKMSWVHTAWMHPPFHEPKPGEVPKLVHFGNVAPGATASERHPLVFYK